MSVQYWDTSALLALLFDEHDSRMLVKLAAGGGKGFIGYTSFFSFIEMEAAYSRRLSDDSLTVESLAELRLNAHHLGEALGVVWANDAILGHARRFISELGLRPGDALQLASSVSLAQGSNEVLFISLDKKLNRAAVASGLMLPTIR